MKSLKFISLVVFSVLPAAMSAASYSVDVKKSRVEWYATKVTGAHNGTINVKNGTLSGDQAKMNGKISIDMNSIRVLDVESPKYNKKLTDHLKSDDFFNAAAFPVASLAVEKLARVEKNEYVAVGRLTIRNKTQTISFPLTVSFDAKGFTATGKLTIDRSKFDVKYGSGSFFDGLGDKMIHDKFDLKFTLRAVKK